MRYPRVMAAAAFLLLFAAQAVRAESPAGQPIFSRMEWSLRQTGDGTWDTAWSLNGRAGIGAEAGLRYSGTALYDISGGMLGAWGGAACEWHLDSFTLTVPGKLEYDGGHTSASLGLTIEPRLKGLEAQLDLAYERRWSNDGTDYRRGQGGLHLAYSVANRLFFGLDAEGSVTRYTDSVQDNRLYGRLSGECRYVTGPGSYIRGRIGWSGFGFPETPENDGSSFRLAFNYTVRPGQWHLSLNADGERSLGRLAENYLQGEFRGKATTPLGPGTMSIESVIDGISHLDPATTARDRVHWSAGAGYRCPLGNTTMDVQLFYESTHYDDGTVEWVFGPVVAFNVPAGEHWRFTAYWAPEGDLYDGGQGLRVAITWIP